MFLGLIASSLNICLGNIKINLKKAQESQLKIGSKNWLKHNTKTVLTAFLKKQSYRKAKFLTMFNYNYSEDFIP